jgi:hypothetical protein
MSAGKTIVAEYAFALAAKVWLTSLVFVVVYFERTVANKRGEG